MIRAIPLLALCACSPGAETGGPDGAPSISDTRWALDEQIGAVVRVAWWQARDGVGRVEYRFEGEDWLVSPARERGAGEQTQALVGIPYDTDVELRVVLETDGEQVEGDVLVARTGPLPDPTLAPRLLAADSTRWEPGGRWLITSLNATQMGWRSGQFYAFILDRQGRVIWARPTEGQHFTLAAQVARDGASLWVDDNTFWSNLAEEPPCQLHRLTLAGGVSESVEIPDANHPWTELPGGRIAWWALPGGGLGELRVREPDGSRWVLLTCEDPQNPFSNDESCLANTVSWREDDDSFLVSLALQDLVLHLDGQDGEILHRFGPRDDAWGFDPPESAFYLQHGVAFTDAGTLLLSAHAGEADETGVAREYALDEAAGLLRQVWSFGEGEGVRADLGGEAQRLPGGNTLHGYGTTPRLREITPAGEVVWDLAWEEGYLLGHASFVEDLWPLVGE